MPNLPHPLPTLVDKDKDNQNGYGWADFEKIAKLRKRPSVTSVARMFNKNWRTIKGWFERYDEEAK